MGKNKNRKRSRSKEKSATNDAAWKPVSVTLSGESNDDRDADTALDPDRDEKQLSKNHYDDPKLSRRAEKDLHLTPGEDCAMFYGLEVLDASQYEVVGTGNNKRLIITGGNDSEHADAEKSVAQPQSNEAPNADETPSKKKRKKDKKKPGDGENIEKASKDDEKSKSKETNEESGSNINDADDAEKEGSSKKGKQKKKKKSTKEDVREAEPDANGSNTRQEATPLSPEELAKIQSSWSESSGGAHIHNRLLESLHRLGFEGPTPIQSATLAAAIMGRRNLVGAAPTGSGGSNRMEPLERYQGIRFLVSNERCSCRR